MKLKKIFLVIAGTLSYIIMITVNYAGTTHLFSQNSVADVSHKYDTLFAPAGYAFIIWGVIFILLFSFMVFQWTVFKDGGKDDYTSATGMWFTISNLSNALWVYFWTNEMIMSSVLMILVLLLSLVILTIRLRLELTDAPVRVIFFVWWPVTFYLGWIMVAAIACIAAWLKSLQLTSYIFSENTWTVTLLIIASLLYLTLIVKRNMREAALVGVWAFTAIAYRQWNAHFDIGLTALMGATVMLIASALHAYKNKSYNIIAKLKRHEW